MRQGCQKKAGKRREKNRKKSRQSWEADQKGAEMSKGGSGKGRKVHWKGVKKSKNLAGKKGDTAGKGFGIANLSRPKLVQSKTRT